MPTLIVAPNWIGDALMAQPLLTLLRAARPDEALVALAPAWVAPVLAAMPEIDRVIPTQLAHGKLQWRERRAFEQALRGTGFGRAFILPNSIKSALIPWLAGIPERIGYLGERRYGLVHRRLPPPAPALPMAQRYAALAEHVGIAVPSVLPEPHLTVAPAAPALRAALGLPAASASGRLIALCPGAEYGPAKRWPAAHFAALADRLCAADPGTTIVLVGGPGDVAIAEQIHALCKQRERMVQCAGKTRLEDAMALLAAADAVVSNDSGLMHVAAALQRPQAAIFGSSDPRHTPPLNRKAEILWLHLECSPCFARTCPLGHTRCLHDLGPDRAARAVEAALAAPARATLPD